MTARISDAEWDALRTSLSRPAARRALSPQAAAVRAAHAGRTPRRRTLGAAVWSLAAVAGIACAIVWAVQPGPAAHHRARTAAVCTIAAPCTPAHACPRNATGHLACAYVLVRTARGLVRMPFRAARAYFRMRKYGGGGMAWLGPVLNAGSG